MRTWVRVIAAAVLVAVSAPRGSEALSEVVALASARHSLTLSVDSSGDPFPSGILGNHRVSAGTDSLGVFSMVAYIPFKARGLSAASRVERITLLLPYSYAGPSPSPSRYVVRAVLLPPGFRPSDLVSPVDYPGTRPVEVLVPGGGSSGYLFLDITSLSASVRPAEWVWLRVEPAASQREDRVDFEFTFFRRPEVRMVVS